MAIMQPTLSQGYLNIKDIKKIVKTFIDMVSYYKKPFIEWTIEDHMNIEYDTAQARDFLEEVKANKEIPTNLKASLEFSKASLKLSQSRFEEWLQKNYSKAYIYQLSESKFLSDDIGDLPF